MASAVFRTKKKRNIIAEKKIYDTRHTNRDGKRELHRNTATSSGTPLVLKREISSGSRSEKVLGARRKRRVARKIPSLKICSVDDRRGSRDARWYFTVTVISRAVRLHTAGQLLERDEGRHGSHPVRICHRPSSRETVLEALPSKRN